MNPQCHTVGEGCCWHLLDGGQGTDNPSTSGRPHLVGLGLRSSDLSSAVQLVSACTWVDECELWILGALVGEELAETSRRRPLLESGTGRQWEWEERMVVHK